MNKLEYASEFPEIYTKIAGKTMGSPDNITEAMQNSKRKIDMITMTRRFYMGSMSLRHGNPPLKLVSEAVEEAKNFLRDHPDCNERYVVEIVKVVRRAEVPIIVEDVRCE